MILLVIFVLKDSTIFFLETSNALKALLDDSYCVLIYYD